MDENRTVKSLVFGKQDQALLDWLMDNCRGNFSGHVLGLCYDAKEPPPGGQDHIARLERKIDALSRQIDALQLAPAPTDPDPNPVAQDQFENSIANLNKLFT